MVHIIKNLPAMQNTSIQSLGWEDPLEKEMLHSPVFLPGKSRGQRSLVSYSPWGRKELDTTERPTLYNTQLHVAVEYLKCC